MEKLIVNLEQYSSRGVPVNNRRYPRCSLYHGIPMRWLDFTKALLKQVNPNLKYRIRYRGKRRAGVRGQAECLKQDAKTFSIYYA